MFPPNKILVVSDGNEMGLSYGTTSSKPKDEVRFAYTYTKSETKLGEKISFTEKELTNYLENSIFKEI